MKEISDDEFNSEENEISDESETNDEPIINRFHKHNLREKRRKINYSESSKKLQNTSVDLQKESENESENESEDESEDENESKNESTEDESENEPEKASKKKSKKRSKKELKKRKKSANSKQIIKRVLIEIVQSLKSYWKEPDQNALISAILDPRYKDLNFLSDELRLQTESRLQIMYDNLSFELNPNNSEISTTKKSSAKQLSNEDSIFNTLFRSESHKKKTNEIDSYLNENITEKPEYNCNPYTWWNDHKKKFPILFILARKFLSIPATSVPSERLFSDAGNNMTNKRTCLSSKIFQELLFIKRNSKYIDIFTLLADKVNIFIEYCI
jgi:hypothetical protein